MTHYLYLMIARSVNRARKFILPLSLSLISPGGWYGYYQIPMTLINILPFCTAIQAAVDAAVGWVTDQTARATCARYWEIGNEIGGPWEIGYFPEISGTYYGDYFADFRAWR